jgi:hypothetical protein
MQELDFQQEIYIVQPEDNKGSVEVGKKSVHNDRAKELKSIQPQDAVFRISFKAKAQSDSLD